LPGDLGAAEPSVSQSDGNYPGPVDVPPGREPDSDYPGPADLEPAGGEEFDEEEARQMLADAGEAVEPVGAAT
jgi:hypothetical protein